MADVLVLVAPQELKGTLTAVEAAEAIAAGVRRALPRAGLDLLPMADGGPGTTDALLAALGGERLDADVHDPLMRPLRVYWGRLSTGAAVVECAAASGLLRLAPWELDPRRASSYGTGELIARALEAGCREVIVGLGGSATNDGGAGLAQALGFRLLDANGRDLPAGGAALGRLERIDAMGALPALRQARFWGATDVTNPLCGPRGASAVYGPQKGADEAAVAELDAALAHLAEVIRRDLGVDVADRPGAGAAGGLGAGLIAFLGAELRSGAHVVGEAAGIEARVRRATLVITGEGRLDGQTAFGKTTHYVASLAAAAGRPVICLAGSLGPGHEQVRALFSRVEVLSDGSLPLPGREEAARQVAAAAERSLLALVAGGLLPTGV